MRKTLKYVLTFALITALSFAVLISCDLFNRENEEQDLNEETTRTLTAEDCKNEFDTAIAETKRQENYSFTMTSKPIDSNVSQTVVEIKCTRNAFRVYVTGASPILSETDAYYYVDGTNYYSVIKKGSSYVKKEISADAYVSVKNLYSVGASFDDLSLVVLSSASATEITGKKTGSKVNIVVSSEEESGSDVKRVEEFVEIREGLVVSLLVKETFYQDGISTGVGEEYTAAFEYGVDIAIPDAA